MDQLAVLEQRYAAVTDSDLSVIGKIFWLTEDCKRYGTLPFAGVARSAFVAMQLLRSFVGVGVLSREDFDAYLNSLSTVSRQVVADIAALQGGEMDKSLFLSRYGHLRPGTYDILSPRYDENYEVYFGAAKNGLPEPGPQAAAAPFAFPRRCWTTWMRCWRKAVFWSSPDRCWTSSSGPPRGARWSSSSSPQHQPDPGARGGDGGAITVFAATTSPISTSAPSSTSTPTWTTATWPTSWGGTWRPTGPITS
jgi:hypothetical protein